MTSRSTFKLAPPQQVYDAYKAIKNSDLILNKSLSDENIEELQKHLNASQPKTDEEAMSRSLIQYLYRKNPTNFCRFLIRSRLSHLILWTEAKCIVLHFGLRGVVYVKWNDQEYECSLHRNVNNNTQDDIEHPSIQRIYDTVCDGDSDGDVDRIDRSNYRGSGKGSGDYTGSNYSGRGRGNGDYVSGRGKGRGDYGGDRLDRSNYRGKGKGKGDYGGDRLDRSNYRGRGKGKGGVGGGHPTTIRRNTYTSGYNKFDNHEAPSESDFPILTAPTNTPMTSPQQSAVVITEPVDSDCDEIVDKLVESQTPDDETPVVSYSNALKGTE
jgi:hypothetical protein